MHGVPHARGTATADAAAAGIRTSLPAALRSRPVPAAGWLPGTLTRVLAVLCAGSLLYDLWLLARSLAARG